MGLRFWTIVAAGAVLWLAPQRSRAVISVFTTRAAFNGAAAGPLTTEGFEAMPLADLTLPATIVPSNLVVSRPAGVVSVYVSDVNQFGFVNTTPAGSKYLAFGRNPPSGSENGNYDAQFGLPAPANAFAFDYSGFQPATFGSGGFTISLLNNGGLVDSTFVADSTKFDADFRGFVSTNVFDTVRLTITTSITIADYTAFDEVTWNVIPEPSGLALLSGLAAVALRRRR